MLPWRASRPSCTSSECRNQARAGHESIRGGAAGGRGTHRAAQLGCDLLASVVRARAGSPLAMRVAAIVRGRPPFFYDAGDGAAPWIGDPGADDPEPGAGRRNSRARCPGGRGAPDSKRHGAAGRPIETDRTGCDIRKRTPGMRARDCAQISRGPPRPHRRRAPTSVGAHGLRCRCARITIAQCHPVKLARQPDSLKS